MAELILMSGLMIESHANESDAVLRDWCDDTLSEIYGGMMPDWLSYELGSAFEYRGQRFREFDCIAGSVTCHLFMRATRGTGISRQILIVGERANRQPVATLIRAGQETEIPRTSIVDAPDAGSANPPSD